MYSHKSSTNNLHIAAADTDAGGAPVTATDYRASLDVSADK